MGIDEHPTAASVRFAQPARDAFVLARRAIVVFGVLSVILLATVFLTFIGAGETSTFMWVRAVLLPAVAVVLYGLTVAAQQGSRRAFERVRGVSSILPIAIVGVDLIPGVCPQWYTVMQIVCMLPVVGLLFATSRPAMRAALQTD